MTFNPSKDTHDAKHTHTNDKDGKVTAFEEAYLDDISAKDMPEPLGFVDKSKAEQANLLRISLEGNGNSNNWKEEMTMPTGNRQGAVSKSHDHVILAQRRASMNGSGSDHPFGQISHRHERGLSFDQANRRTRTSQVSDNNDGLDSNDISMDETLFPDQTRINSMEIDDSQVRGNMHQQCYSRGQTTILSLVVQVMPVITISVCGLLVTGYIMDLVTNLETFEKIPAMLVLIPVLLNIKGNIEANMSTRLSTLANMGVLDSPSQRKDIIFANLGLLLLQALLTSFAVTTTSGLISLIPLSKEADGAGDSATILPWFSGFTITVASGVSSALLGSTLIGSLVCAIVTLSSRFGINPDNVSNPIASGFGDMVTLFFLAGSSLLWLRYFGPVLHWVVISALAFVCGLLVYNVKRNEHVKDIVTQGWLPLLYAALTSSIAGLLMERYVEDLVGMASLLPVFNGIGGNIASVFASRLSTSLHRGDSNDKEEKRTLWTLLGLGIPIQLMFLGTVKLMGFAHGAITPVFVLVYIIASSIQVFSLLCLAKLGTKRLWAMSYDPDNYINPIITGTGDMLGTVLLVSVFLIV